MAQFPAEQSKSGAFKRQEDAFRDWVRRDGSSAYGPERDRYHLYVSLACPWAHRTIILRKLKGLEEAIGMTVVDPVRDERGWAFRDGPGHSADPVNSFEFLSEAYHATDPGYRGRVTVPVLWNKETKRIVSNSDDDIMRMFNREFGDLATTEHDFYPADLSNEIDALNKLIYERVNNGVYLAGFATRQKPHETAVQNFSKRSTTRSAPVEAALFVRHDSDGVRLAPFPDAHSLRRRLPRPLQVQSPPHCRLPEPLAVFARPLSARRNRRDREL